MMKTPFTGPLRPLKYGEDYVRFVSVTNCFGIEIDHQLSWNAQIGKVSKNYKKKISALKRMKLPKKVLEEIYQEWLMVYLYGETVQYHTPLQRRNYRMRRA